MSGERPSTDIAKERKNTKAYRIVSEGLPPELPTWYRVMASRKSRRYDSRLERKLDVPVLKVIETVNGDSNDAVDYGNHYLP